MDAVDCYAEVLEHEPGAWRAHFHLAKLHLNVGLVAAAAGHLRATLEVNPDFAPAQDAMSKLSGIDVEALQASQRYIDIQRYTVYMLNNTPTVCRRALTSRSTRWSSATAQVQPRPSPSPSPSTSRRWASYSQTRRGRGSISGLADYQRTAQRLEDTVVLTFLFLSHLSPHLSPPGS